RVMIATGATPVSISRWQRSFISSNALIIHTLFVLTWRKTHGLLHIEALDVSDSHRFRRSQRRWGPRPEPIERRACSWRAPWSGRRRRAARRVDRAVSRQLGRLQAG